MRFFLATTFFLLSFGSLLRAVEIRVATYNVRLGLGPVGDPGRDGVEAVLARIAADVVALQEITSDDLANERITALGQTLGYPHLFIPESALDTSSRVAILSRFPFVPNSPTSILSPPGANDVTRAAAAVVVDVPNTLNDPTIITAHLKCCFELDDPFRRAIEMTRIRNFLVREGLDGDDNVIVMGDFNLLGSSNLTYPQIPPGLPPSFILGNDITFNVDYFVEPTRYFQGLGMTDPESRQQDGVTDRTFPGSSTVLDYLLISSALASRNPKTEIYNSNLEATYPGLHKAGSPLPATTSADASDHLPVFGDLQLDNGLELSLTASQTILDEGETAATLTVTLDQPALTPTPVTLVSGDPSEVVIANPTLVIPNGQTTATTSFFAPFDKISDGTQEVAISASAPGFDGAFLAITVRDADPLRYRLTSLSMPVREDFTRFTGTQKPATWSDGGLTWHGEDAGNLTTLGGRSYQNSLGILAATPTLFQTTLRNDTGETIAALSVAYEAMHWRRSPGGSQDELRFSYLRNGATTPIPALTFAPSVDGSGGALVPPESSILSTYLRGLNLAPGEELQLMLALVPGQLPPTVSDDVFINEFHYDNIGVDTGEFIEVFVGPDFGGLLSDLSIQLYNGNNGLAYGSPQNLQTFLTSFPEGPNGPGLFHKAIPGIQNGSPDGIALVVGEEVREFISYEGAFTAVDGIAAGMASTPIGVAQASPPVGQNSIARTGSGAKATDFTWHVQPGPHTPGAVNVGQTFGTSPQPQGLAMDNLVITPLKDSDGDLLPDEEEALLGTNPNQADTDHDGQDDRFETLLAGTNPLSSSDYLRLKLETNSSGLQLSFPSLPGRLYQVEVSRNLSEWTTLPAIAGTGDLLTESLPAGQSLFFRLRVSLP